MASVWMFKQIQNVSKKIQSYPTLKCTNNYANNATKH